MESLNKQFGLVIAYLLPGFVVLAGLAPLMPIVHGWLQADQRASYGAPLYALLAATAAGMVASCFRWIVIDRIHLLTGLSGPAFNARALEERPAAVSFLVENYYRYHQFYANTLVAVGSTYAVHRWLGTSSHLGIGTDMGVLVLGAVLFAGSRDALAKYRNRTKELGGYVLLIDAEDNAMTNGADHNQGGTSDKPSKPKPGGKPAATPKPAQGRPADSKGTSSHK